MKKDIKAGASVITKMASTNSIKVLVKASGLNNFPSWPVSMNTGKKEAMIIIVEKKTPLETCLHDRSIIPKRISSGITL